MKQARADIQACARYFEFYGGAADKLHGETIPFLKGYLVATEREPHGVTGHIIPWNYPAQMYGRSMAAALAVGNATVLKPAEDACMTPLRLTELAAEVGFPGGAINVVPGYGEEAGAALTAHPGIDFMSFTGSPEVGTLVQTACAKNHIGCTLELGGKSPQVVFADVDLETALPTLVNAIVQNAGQTCSAGSRLLVERSGYDRIVGAVIERFGKLQAGTPEMDLDLGPVINPGQRKRVERFCNGAGGDGIPLLAEGRIADGVPEGGYFVAPKLYGPGPARQHARPRRSLRAGHGVIPFDDEADAIATANGTEFGLIAGVWTENARRATRVARQVRAGQVYVNAYGAGGGIELPFGGMKSRGTAARRDLPRSTTSRCSRPSSSSTTDAGIGRDGSEAAARRRIAEDLGLGPDRAFRLQRPGRIGLVAVERMMGADGPVRLEEGSRAKATRSASRFAMIASATFGSLIRPTAMLAMPASRLTVAAWGTW